MLWGNVILCRPTSAPSKVLELVSASQFIKGVQLMNSSMQFRFRVGELVEVTQNCIVI